MSRFPPGSKIRAVRMIETFFAEAAVLLFVFPVLDEYVQHGNQGVTLGLIVISVVAALFFLALAVLLAATHGDHE